MSPEEVLQTKMMEGMLREKAKESKTVRRMLKAESQLRKEQEKAKSNSENARAVKLGLGEPNGALNDGELMLAMTKIVPMVATLYTSSPNWLIRDRALEVLREIHSKFGKTMIWRHIGPANISEEQKRVLKFLLTSE